MQLIRSWRLLPFIFAGFTPALAYADPIEPAVTGKGIVGGALLGGEAVMLTEAALKVKPAWAYYIGGGAGMIGGGIGGYFLEDHLGSKEAMYMLSVGMLLAIPTTVAALNAVSYDTPLEYTQDAPPVDEGADETISATAPAPLPTMPAANASPTEGTPAEATPPTPATNTQPPAATTPAPSPAPATTPGSATPSTSPDTTPTKPQGARQLNRSRALAHSQSAPVMMPPALFDFSGTQLALGLPTVEVRGTYTRREMAMYGVKQQTEVRIPVFQMMF